MSKKVVRAQGMAAALRRYTGDKTITSADVDMWMILPPFEAQYDESAKKIDGGLKKVIGEKKYNALDAKGDLMIFVLKQLNVKTSNAWMRELGQDGF